MKTKIIEWNIEVTKTISQKKLDFNTTQSLEENIVANGSVYIEVSSNVEDSILKNRVEEVIKAGLHLQGKDFLDKDAQISKLMFFKEHLNIDGCDVKLVYLNDLKQSKNIVLEKRKKTGQRIKEIKPVDKNREIIERSFRGM